MSITRRPIPAGSIRSNDSSPTSPPTCCSDRITAPCKHSKPTSAPRSKPGTRIPSRSSGPKRRSRSLRSSASASVISLSRTGTPAWQTFHAEVCLSACRRDPSTDVPLGDPIQAGAVVDPRPGREQASAYVGRTRQVLTSDRARHPISSSVAGVPAGARSVSRSPMGAWEGECWPAGRCCS